MLKQQLRQQLQQKLSPQQIQMIRLLELPAIELEEKVKHELEENPALEEGKSNQEELEHEEERSPDDEGADMEGSEGDSTDLSLGDYLTEDDIPDYKLQELHDRNDKKEDIPFSAGESLNEYLLEQLSLRELPEQERKIAEYIIGNIDDDGYLRRDLNSIADDLVFQAGLNVSGKEIEPILTIVQDFEPSGVGARDLQECLSIQLQKKEPMEATPVALQIIKDYFNDFIRKHYDKILKGMDISEDTLKKAIHEITTLNPKPGNAWGDSIGTAMSQIVPDFIVDANNGEITLSMNNRGIPDLRVNQEYVNMFQDYAGNKANQTAERKNAVQFVKQKLDSAQWFIDAIKQRQETLQRTMEAIIQLQREFFLTGDETALRPMILKDVAERTGYDISTISRVSNSKYVQTNFGIYPLKFFFSESMQTDSGEEISTREVKKIMREHLDAEDKRKPLTDEELANILKEKGYVIARRTVAKYREQLGIPVARLRKEI
ncbi:MAG TPA: RNA polymerase sigma-54 factor [Parabacteroides sp.]|nr:RNA polymerase sigma-54 factor [Parabacteroides sp.]